MRFRYLSDLHLHTDNSPDGVDPVMMMCERAAALGLYAVAVTDHCECEVYREQKYDRSIFQSFFETRKAHAVFRGRLKVLIGMELGQPLHDPAAAEEALHSSETDFVLGSVHSLPGEQDFYYLEYTRENIYPLLTRYFDEILRLVKWGRFDSLAHLTYPLRYIIGNYKIPVDMTVFQERIDEILTLLIASRKALELNTSGLRQPVGETSPNFEILERYHQLGGKYLTIGSDAHRWADVGAGLEIGMEMAARAGFQHFTIYEKHEPHLLPIL